MFLKYSGTIWHSVLLIAGAMVGRIRHNYKCLLCIWSLGVGFIIMYRACFVGLQSAQGSCKCAALKCQVHYGKC